MRHLKHRHQLGRKKEHRTALMANMAAALLKHDRIKTTLPKAKALRPFVEKIITLAKKAEGASPERALAYRRLAIARVRDKDAVAVLFREKVAEFTERSGGYTRIYKLGTRIGDAAEMAVIQLVPGSDEGYGKKGRPAKKKKAKAAPVETEEEVVEEAPAEEVAVADEAPADEAPAEEAPTPEEKEDEKPAGS
jgi:large subunit ribosomal protein L17